MGSGSTTVPVQVAEHAHSFKPTGRTVRANAKQNAGAVILMCECGTPKFLGGDPVQAPKVELVSAKAGGLQTNTYRVTRKDGKLADVWYDVHTKLWTTYMVDLSDVPWKVRIVRKYKQELEDLRDSGEWSQVDTILAVKTGTPSLLPITRMLPNPKTPGRLR